MSRKSVLILSYVPFYNRQGFDLHQSLVSVGCRSTLIQLGAKTDAGDRIFGIKESKPVGTLHAFYVLINLFRFLVRSLFCPKHIIVAIGRPIFPILPLYKKVFRSEVIYYSLEYHQFSGIAKHMLRTCVDKIIDVEKNRLARLLGDNGLLIPSIVVHNMPHLHKQPHGGRLRNYLKTHHGLDNKTPIAIYAGSYQPYVCMERIVDAARLLSGKGCVVLMSYNIPTTIVSHVPDNVYVVPPVSGDDFYDWLCDADCALLPYESSTNFNVQFCSPQKIYDCYLTGVPFIASKRPIIEQALAKDSSIGELCCFDDVAMIADCIGRIWDRDRESCRERMIALHETVFCYESQERALLSFVGMMA